MMRGTAGYRRLQADLGMMSMTRALATISTVTGVYAHPDANSIEIAVVRGWDCVVRKDQHMPGDRVLYIEIDTHLPKADERFAFLMGRGVRMAPDGFEGHVLRTVRLRGIISQGLVMGLDDFPEVAEHPVGADVTDVLGLRLWEQPIPLGDDICGQWPKGFPKTDEERVQNLDPVELADALRQAHSIDVREKLDGSSLSLLNVDGRIAVCSRNYEIRKTSGRAIIALNSPAGEWFKEDSEPGNLMQGESVGPGVQGNPLRLATQQWRPFTLGHCVPGTGLVFKAHPNLWASFALDQAVPSSFPAGDMRGWLSEDWVRFADGLESQLSPGKQAEGVVVRCYDSAGLETYSFKALNNNVLARQAKKGKG